MLADAAFASAEFLAGVKELRLGAVVDMRMDRVWLLLGRLAHLGLQVWAVTLRDIPFPVWAAWYDLRHPDRRAEERFAIGTDPMKPQAWCVGASGVGGSRLSSRS